MTGITDKELDQLLRDAQERADSYPFDDYILEVAIPALVAEVRRHRAAIENVLKEHGEIWSCGNPRHTNPEVGCPDCSVECDTCGCAYPCATVMAIRDAIGGAK